MDKEFDDAVTAICNRYGRHGVKRDTIAALMKSGMESSGLSLRTVYNGMRMSLAGVFGEHETFTVGDMMEITGESREEVIKSIEDMREKAAANGEDPDDYATPVDVPTHSAHYFKNGLH